GLTRGTQRAHIARAALEGIALQITNLVEAMAIDAGTPLQRLRVDGGAAANDLLMQIQSDLLGLPLGRPANLESTALGAAALAGLGLGWWPDLHALDSTFEVERTFEPRADPERIAMLRREWARAVAQA